jgi:hypothetical protein
MKESIMAERTDRRCFLARGIAGAAGVGAAYGSIEERILLAATEGAAQPAAKPRPKVDIPPGSLPCGKIANVSVSRLIIGGNLIGGWAHSRDLMYASKLFTSYNTEAKIFETLELAQECGINTIQIDPRAWGTVLKYNKGRATKMQTIPCISLMEDKTKLNDEIKLRIEQGATMIYSHGGDTDAHMMNGGKIDRIGQMVDAIKAQGVPAGVGGHSLNMVKACEAAKLNVDFYVKTLHIDRYWSATPKDHRKEYDWLDSRADDHNANNDGMWCNNPEETIAFMQHVEKPWIAFKVMAAGAISPRIAFSHAYRGGADFVLAGMFDFQVETDAKLAIESLKQATSRKRPWRA